MAFDGQIAGFTQYRSEAAYGIPTSLIFSDSHSAFIASFLNAGPNSFDLYNDLAPTDESPDTRIDAVVRFNVLSNSTITYTADSTGAWWMLLVEDENGNLLHNDEDYYTRSGSFALAAGAYQVRYASSHNFWNGGSFAHSGLVVSSVPEPATLLVLAPAALLLRRRRR